MIMENIANSAAFNLGVNKCRQRSSKVLDEWVGAVALLSNSWQKENESAAKAAGFWQGFRPWCRNIDNDDVSEQIDPCYVQNRTLRHVAPHTAARLLDLIEASAHHFLWTETQ